MPSITNKIQHKGFLGKKKGGGGVGEGGGENGCFREKQKKKKTPSFFIKESGKRLFTSKVLN